MIIFGSIFTSFLLLVKAELVRDFTLKKKTFVKLKQISHCCQGKRMLMLTFCLLQLVQMIAFIGIQISILIIDPVQTSEIGHDDRPTSTFNLAVYCAFLGKA